MSQSSLLAWKQKPEPKGVLYTSKELSDRQNVIDLFDACKHKTGYINAEGWQFLFLKYGLNELLIIDLDIKWFNSLDLKSHSCDMIYEAMIAGYNPINSEMGDYDDETKTFISLNGEKRFIDWDNL